MACSVLSTAYDRLSRTKSYPDAPGPPGLTSSDPRRLPVAGLRIRASLIDAFDGFFQSIGAVTLVHWKPLEQFDHVSTCE